MHPVDPELVAKLQSHVAAGRSIRDAAWHCEISFALARRLLATQPETADEKTLRLEAYAMLREGYSIEVIRAVFGPVI